MHDKDSVLCGIKILVVEHDADVLEVTTLILTLYHAEVIAASMPHEGLEQVKRYRPDIILTDIAMPHMDGYQFISAVRICLHMKGAKPRPLPLPHSIDLKTASAQFKLGSKAISPNL